jgi:hypothetical protein
MTKNSVLTKTLLACNNNEITEVSHIKFLGLVIDNTTWNLHIDSVINKLTRVCYMIRTLYASFFTGNDLLLLISHYIILLAVPSHALLWLSLVKWKRKKRESARL